MSMLSDDSLDSQEFARAEPQVSRQCHRIQPELGTLIIAIDMHVCGFIRLMAIEVEAVRSLAIDRRLDD